jgi:hypothetical protein
VLQTADIFTRYGQAAALRNLGPLRRRVYGRDGSSTERLRLSITRLLSLRKPNKTSVVGACRPVIDWGVQGISGMGFNQRRMARERAAAERAEEERRPRELGRDRVQAEKLVAVWNSRAARKARAVVLPDNRDCAAGRGALVGLPVPVLPAYRRC